MLKRLLKSQIALSVFAYIISLYIWLVLKTSRRMTEPASPDDALLDQMPCIGTFWHGDFLMIPAMKPKNTTKKFHCMVAQHGDAEIVDKVLNRFGLYPLRGAGAGKRKKDRGGAKVLRASLKALEEGDAVTMTADIPPGPGRKAGLGVVTLAKLSGRPIVPGAIATTRRITFNSWDRFTVNLPFSKMAYVVGTPITVDRKLDEAQTEAVRQEVEEELNRITRRAYELIGHNADNVLANEDGQKMKPGFRLNAYKYVTGLARHLAPFILNWRAKKGKEDTDRQNERLGLAERPRPEGKLLWFHAASVGETNAILPVLTALSQSHPHVTLLLTTGTVTSEKAVRSRLPENAIHQYVPLDSPMFVDRFLNHWKPDLALFTESEIWPNLILQSADRDIPLILLNGRMSSSSYRSWRRQSGFSRPLFSRFDLILAQNEKLATRFRTLGALNSIPAGNLKVDSPAPPVDAKKLEQMRASIQSRPIFVAASTHPGEDEVIIEAHKILREKTPNLLTILIPRHPERGRDISQQLSINQISHTQRSLDELPSQDSEVYIADTIGELGIFYTIGEIAFIGGSIVDKGGQNPIEAARMNTAILTGPHWSNFKDTYSELINAKGGKEVTSAQDLAAQVQILLDDEAQRKIMIKRADEAIENLSGALKKTLEAIETYLPAPEAPRGMRRAS